MGSGIPKHGMIVVPYQTTKGRRLMAYSASPRPAGAEIRAKQPSQGWIKLENFLTRIGLLYPQKPFKDVLEDIRVEDGGRRIYSLEEKKVKKSKVLQFPQDTMNEIGIVTPMNINQAASPADMLKSGRSILCNFHGIDKKNLDPVRFFLMGVVYAIGGQCKKINDTIYLFTPAHMDVYNDPQERTIHKKERKMLEEDDELLDQMFGT